MDKLMKQLISDNEQSQELVINKIRKMKDSLSSIGVFECKSCDNFVNTESQGEDYTSCSLSHEIFCSGCNERHIEDCPSCKRELNHGNKFIQYLSEQYSGYCWEPQTGYVLLGFDEMGYICVGKDINHSGNIIELTKAELEDPSFKYGYNYRSFDKLL